MGTAKRRVTRRRKARKAKKVSARLAKRQVFEGRRTKTNGKLQKSSLMMNKRGRVVSKKMSARGKQVFKKHLSGWQSAFMQARKNLGVTGFVAIKKGTKL